MFIPASFMQAYASVTSVMANLGSVAAQKAASREQEYQVTGIAILHPFSSGFVGL